MLPSLFTAERATRWLAEHPTPPRQQPTEPLSWQRLGLYGALALLLAACLLLAGVGTYKQAHHPGPLRYEFTAVVKP